MTHFAECVSKDLQEKLLELAEYVEEDFISDYSHNAYGCMHINAIYGHHISGFIPFQNGGYEVTEFYSNGWTTGCYFNKAQEEFEAETYEYMLECFARDYYDYDTDKAKEWAKNYSYDDLTDDDRYEFENYENEWFEGVLLRFEMWIERDANNDNKCVMARLSVNYRDAPYYRSTSDDTLVELELDIKEIMGLTGDKLIEKLKEKEK